MINYLKNIKNTSLFHRLVIITLVIPLLLTCTYANRYGFGPDQRYKAQIDQVLADPHVLESSKRIIRNAVELKERIEKYNYKDIHNLLREIRHDYPHANYSNQISQEVRKRTIRRMSKDLQLLNVYQNAIIGLTRGEADMGLRKGINYLINGTNRAREILKNGSINLQTGTLNDQEPTNATIRHLKHALICLFLESKGYKNILEARQHNASPTLVKSLKLFFPAKTPTLRNEWQEKIKECSLYDDMDSIGACLRIPNAGYVLGGYAFEHFRHEDNKVRAVECSAFVCKAAECSARVKTAHMEKIWKYLMNRTSEGKRKLIRSLGRERASAINDYIPIDIDGELGTAVMEPGDIVVFRPHGHVVLFVKWTNRSQGKFLAIHSTIGYREGSGYQELGLRRDERRVYVLRRKPLGTPGPRTINRNLAPNHPAPTPGSSIPSTSNRGRHILIDPSWALAWNSGWWVGDTINTENVSSVVDKVKTLTYTPLSNDHSLTTIHALHLSNPTLRMPVTQRYRLEICNEDAVHRENGFDILLIDNKKLLCGIEGKWLTQEANTLIDAYIIKEALTSAF